MLFLLVVVGITMFFVLMSALSGIESKIARQTEVLEEIATRLRKQFQANDDHFMYRDSNLDRVSTIHNLSERNDDMNSVLGRMDEMLRKSPPAS